MKIWVVGETAIVGEAGKPFKQGGGVFLAPKLALKKMIFVAEIISIPLLAFLECMVVCAAPAAISVGLGIERPAIIKSQPGCIVMTFKDVHKDLSGCNCINLLNAVDNITASFTRCIGEREANLSWFRSNHAMGKAPKRELKTNDQRCMWRGISVNKLAANQAAIKEFYQKVSLISPKSNQNLNTKYVCIFRMKRNAGKVADTSRNNPAAAHHTMFTCDGFDFECLEVISVTPFEEF